VPPATTFHGLYAPANQLGAHRTTLAASGVWRISPALSATPSMKKPSALIKASWFTVGLVWFPLFEIVVLVAAVALIKYTFFLSPDARPPVHGDPGEAPAEIASFIPADWRVLQHVATDMDRDGSGDFALLLGPSHAGLGSTDKTPLQDRCRNLLLLYRKEGGYERAQYLPWRLRVFVDPSDEETQTMPCPFSEAERKREEEMTTGEKMGLRFTSVIGDSWHPLEYSAEFLSSNDCLVLVNTSARNEGTASDGCSYSSTTEVNFITKQVLRTSFNQVSDEDKLGCEDDGSDDPLYMSKNKNPPEVSHFRMTEKICVEDLTAIFEGGRFDGDCAPLHPIIQSAIGPTIPFADVDAPFLPKAPTARKQCATPPQAMVARTAQGALPLRIRQPQTLAEPITSPAATTVFSLGQTILEGTERCSYQAATLWAEDDCGLWVRFNHATDCPYDVKREGPLDNDHNSQPVTSWNGSNPLEWSGAMGSYFALPREQDGSYLLSRLPSISNACDGPCKNELLPIRFKRVGRGRFVATEVRAEDVPPPEQEGLW